MEERVLQESAYMLFLHWALGPTERPVSGKETGKKQDIGRAKDGQEFEETHVKLEQSLTN